MVSQRLIKLLKVSLSICGNLFFADKCQLSEDILLNTNARLVESKSGQRPYFVVKQETVDTTVMLIAPCGSVQNCVLKL